jgi:Putative DNA-binding domain
MQYLGQYMPTPETFDIEYKEFCLKKTIQSLYDEGTVRHLIETGHVPTELFQLFEENIRHYLDCYLAKYIATFGNSMSNGSSKSEGHLYIGISDDGEITGIPTNLSAPQLKQKIDTWIRELLPKKLYFQMQSTSAGTCADNKKQDIYLEHYLSAITIKVHPLSFHPKYTNNDALESYIHMLEQEKKRIHQIRDTIYSMKHAWYKVVEYHKRKIIVLINDIPERHKIYHWALEQGCTSLKALEFLRSSVPLTYLTTEMIVEEKNNEEHYMYWVLTYRDHKISEVIRQRPMIPSIHSFKRKHFYFAPMNKLRDMRYTWSVYNQTVKYYVIEIILPCQERLKEHFSIDETFSILLSSSSSFEYKRRTVDAFGVPYSE